MQYNGFELAEITESQTFDPPKKLAVWNDESTNVVIENVLAIVSRYGAYGNNRIICCYNGVGSGYNRYYQHCAELPEMPKYNTLATNSMISHWLADGNGQILFVDSGTIQTYLCYNIHNEGHIPESNIKVRKFGDSEWQLATKAYLGVE